mgnify:CR=1 FL=1
MAKKAQPTRMLELPANSGITREDIDALKKKVGVSSDSELIRKGYAVLREMAAEQDV